MARCFGFCAVLLGALTLLGCVSVQEPDTRTCAGQPPTHWYLTEVAPTLPVWQQHPDRLAPATIDDHAYQGLIEVRRFDMYNDETLACWAEGGDKLAAFSLADRLNRILPRSDVPDQRVLSMLELATVDTCGRQASLFCEGVSNAAYYLAQYRRVHDDEYFRLMRRARDGGFGLAAWELAGRQPPQLGH